MRPRDFYNFCKNHRTTEPDRNKEKALRAVYNFMFECGNSKRDVMTFIYLLMDECKDNLDLVEAYNWMLGILEGTVPSDESLMLFPVQGSEA